MAEPEYAVYKGDELQTIGTAQECADELGIKPETVRWYASAPSYLKRGKGSSNRRVVIKLEDEP